MTVEELRAMLASSEAWEPLYHLAESSVRERSGPSYMGAFIAAGRWQIGRLAFCDERARQIAQVLVAERVAVLALCDALEPHLSPDAPGPDPDQRARLKALLDSVRGAS